MLVESSQLVISIIALVIAVVALIVARRTHSVSATRDISEWFRRVIFAWGAAYNVRKFRGIGAKEPEVARLKIEIWALIEEGRLFFPNWNFENSRERKGYRGAILTFIATECYNRIADEEMNFDRFNDSLRKLIEIANRHLPSEYTNTINGYDDLHKKLIENS